MSMNLRQEPVGLLAREDRFVQDRMLTQFVGERAFPMTREGRMRNCAAPGCANCKRRAVMIVRGISVLARRLLGANSPDSV